MHYQLTLYSSLPTPTTFITQGDTPSAELMDISCPLPGRNGVCMIICHVDQPQPYRWKVGCKLTVKCALLVVEGRIVNETSGQASD